MDAKDDYLEPLLSETHLDFPAGAATEFETALAVAMGGVLYFGDPTTSPVGYASYKRGGKEKHSIALTALKNSHNDSFVDRAVFGNLREERLAPGEEQAIRRALVKVGEDSVSKLFVTSLLELIKRKDVRGAEYLKQFLSYWGGSYLRQSTKKCYSNSLKR